MKRAAIVIAVLGIAAWSFGQNTNKPASSGQAAPATATQGKRAPQAKTQPEFDAYKAAIALTDAAAQEKAADDFAAKFPDSELRIWIYKSAMNAYLQSGNQDKGLDLAHKILGFDGDDPDGLIAVGQVLADRTRETDLDRDQRLAEAKKTAERALVTVETDAPTAGQPPERVEAYKGYIRSEAYEILGKIAFDAKAWAEAESNLRKSIDAFPQQPDPIAIYRLAVSLDMQDKLDEAIKFCNQAVELTKEDTAAGKAARTEKERLTQLKSGRAPGQNPAPQKN